MHTDARSRLSSIDALLLPATGQSEPVKVFDRHPTLNDTQIINYKTSPDEKWMVLIGIKSEVPHAAALSLPCCICAPARGAVGLLAARRGLRCDTGCRFAAVVCAVLRR